MAIGGHLVLDPALPAAFLRGGNPHPIVFVREHVLAALDPTTRPFWHCRTARAGTAPSRSCTASRSTGSSPAIRSLAAASARIPRLAPRLLGSATISARAGT